MNYVFDVDGTLTPSRLSMIPEFKSWFVDWCKDRPVFLVTGSDYAKTLAQVGEEVTHAVRAVYNSSGNAIYVKGQLVYKYDFSIGSDIQSYLETILVSDPYPVRTGQHIEHRIGLTNFSIVGRGADRGQRAEYIKYDRDTGNRAMIVDRINELFPHVEATAGGETGVDIYERGRDKAQVAGVLSPFIFFGDSIFPGGNDYTIAQEAVKYYRVKDWQETYQILREQY